MAEDYERHLQQLANDRVWTIDSIETMNYMAQLDRPGKLITAYRT